MKRTVLITGASSGIGRAVAERLLDEGHTVIGVARTIGSFQPATANFHPIELDLAELDALPQRLQALTERFSQLDAAVFSAGRGQFGALEEFSFAQIRALMELNFTSQAYCARAMVPVFKRKKRGDLIFIGSEAALEGRRNGTVYCASKFALRGFTQALREECSSSNIRVSLINPGMVRTAFFDQLHFEPGPRESQSIQPDEIAELIAFLLKLRAGTNLDEINLSPLHKVIHFKSRSNKKRD